MTRILPPFARIWLLTLIIVFPLSEHIYAANALSPKVATKLKYNVVFECPKGFSSSYVMIDPDYLNSALNDRKVLSEPARVHRLMLISSNGAAGVIRCFYGVNRKAKITNFTIKRECKDIKRIEKKQHTYMCAD